jgi:hypothetical protein
LAIFTALAEVPFSVKQPAKVVERKRVLPWVGVDFAKAESRAATMWIIDDVVQHEVPTISDDERFRRQMQELRGIDVTRRPPSSARLYEKLDKLFLERRQALFGMESGESKEELAARVRVSLLTSVNNQLAKLGVRK